MSRPQASRPTVFSRLWAKAFADGRRKSSSARPARVRPQLEHLEDRLVPAVIDVTTLADGTGPGTLRSAIAQANTNNANGDTTNTIDLTVAGTYNIGQLGLGALAIFTNATAAQSGLSLTIQNTSGGNVAINGNNTTRVFDINPNDIIQSNPNVALGAVTISGVTIENGLAQPGDGATGSGGGIRDQGPVDLNLNNDVLTNNVATADGGGVSMENATSTHWALMLNNTTVSNNHAGDAGGGVEEDGTGLVNITNSILADNTTLNQGAGVWLDAINGGTATLNVTNSVVSGNTAGMLAGGIGQAGSSTVTITNSTIENNFTPGFGGGFGDQNNTGSLVVQNSLFLNNSAGTNGGGIQEGGPSTTITNSEIKGNAAGINGAMPIGTSGGGKPSPVMGSGGGLFINGGALTLTSSSIADNTATINGGGIELQGNGTSIITNSSIAGNTALNNAGGNEGGGIDGNNFQGNLSLLDDTITNNFASTGGGLFWTGNSGSVKVQNTLIASNTAANGPDVFDMQATVLNFTDLGGNFIGIDTQTNGFSAANGSQVGTAANPLNPLIAGLTNNGGQTAGAPGTQMIVETEALLPGSRAIGKGIANGITTDERGAPRPTTPDVGAFQFENATLTLTIHASPTVAINGREPIVVTVTNTSNNPLPADNSILTVTTTGGLSGGPQSFTVGALGAGQSVNFTVNTTATALGTQTITATVVSPDTNPSSVSTTKTVNVITTLLNPTTNTNTNTNTNTPVGALTPFALGFGPDGLDLFEIDSRGDVFAAAFHPGAAPGTPHFLTNTLQFSMVQVADGALLGFLQDANQRFLVDVFNPSNPLVVQAILGALHL